MKKFILIFFYLIICMLMLKSKLNALDKVEHITTLESNDVHIAPHAIRIPLEKILLVRKDSEYCAIKFIRFWTGKTDQDRYAEYESYYQGDNTGNFSSNNVKFKKGKLSFPKPRGIGRFAFSFGNRNIRCGPLKLQWTGRGTVYFYKEGQDEADYGIELAPTIWSDITEVNVFDPRIKWYRYDLKRERINIPIDKLWEKEPGGCQGDSSFKMNRRIK